MEINKAIEYFEKEVEWQRMCKMARLEKRIEDAKKLAKTD